MTNQIAGAEASGQWDQSAYVARLKQAVQYVELGQHGSANDLCLELIGRDPGDANALGILLENTRRSELLSEAFRGLLDIASAIPVRPPAAMLEVGKDLLVERDIRHASMQRFLEDWKPEAAIRNNIYEPRNYSGFAFLLEMLDQELKAEFVRRTHDLFRRLAEGEPDGDLLGNIRTGEFAPEKAGDKGWVGFVADIKHLRLRQLAQSMRDAGKKVRLYTRQPETAHPEAESSFDEVIYFASPFELFGHFQDDDASAIHVLFEGGCGYLEAAVTLMLRPDKVYFDKFDLVLKDITPLEGLAENSRDWRDAAWEASAHRFFSDHMPASEEGKIYPDIREFQAPAAGAGPREALENMERGQFAEANEHCLAAIRRDPGDASALALLLRNASRGYLAASAFMGLWDIATGMNEQPPEAMLDSCRGLMAGNEYRHAWMRQFIDKWHLDTAIQQDIFELRNYARSAFVLDMMGQGRKARLVRRTYTIFNAIRESDGEADFLDEINSGALAPGGSNVAGDQEDWVYFIAGTLHVRMRKIAKAVRSEQKKVRLFVVSHSPIAPEIQAYFDDIVYMDTPFDLFDHVQNSNPLAFHVFFAADHGFLEAIIMMLLHPGKVIFDANDLALKEVGHSRRLGRLNKSSRQARQNASCHRFLFNHSPAICCRALFAKKHKSLLPNAAGQKRIYLPELAWGYELNRTKLSAKDGKLHVVYGGTFLAENVFGSQWAFFRTLAENAEALDIHFHLYPVPWGDPDMSVYDEIAHHSNYFHIHENLSYDGWMDQLQMYDVGLYYIRANDSKLEGTIPLPVDPSGFWANKVGDFIDANVYALSPPTAKSITFVTERYGAGERACLDTIFTKRFWKELRIKILVDGVNFSAAKQNLNTNAQGCRLIEFYKTVSAAA